MTAVRPLLVVVLLAAGTLLSSQRDDQTRPDASKPDKFSPLGYYDLLAYEQAFPGEPGSPLVRQASSEKYWAYQGTALRTGAPASSIWTSLGPLTTLTTGAESVSGRVSALAISPTCRLDGRCRLWVGTAGGGVWRTDRAMHPDDPGWRWVSHGLGTNNIGSLAIDPSDRSGNTILVGTGETNYPEQLRRRHRALSVGRRRRSLDARADDDRGSGRAARRQSTSRSRAASAPSSIDPRQSADDLHRHGDGDAGHDRRARRPVASPPGFRSRASGCTRPRTAG